MGIPRSEKRDLGGPGEGFSRDLETPKVRNGFRAQRGVAQEELRVLRVGCQSEKRLAKDFLRLRMVSAFTSSWLRLGLGGAGFELGVRGSPGSGGWRHILAGFLGQLRLGGSSSRARATGPRLLRGGWPSAGHGTRLAGLACGAGRARGFLGWALALLTARWGPRGLWRSLTGDGCLPGSLWGARLALGRWGGGWAGCWRCPRSSCHRPGLAALTLGQRWGLGHRLLGR